MRYVGGKSRISKWVRDHVLGVSNGRKTYLEPFVGSGAIFDVVSPSFENCIAADAHEDLILMWQQLASGWVPPEHVTREEYAALKTAPPSALRGLVGFGASFGGKWFGGYVDTAWDAHWDRFTKPYLAAARTSVLKMVPAFSRAKIVYSDYRNHVVDSDTLVYCDPPYAGTLGYAGSQSFDSVEFWKTMSLWVDAGAMVVVSEAQAPAGWHVLAERERKAMMRVSVGEENQVRREALWVKKSPA